MFTKVLILVLLGSSSLVVSSPVTDGTSSGTSLDSLGSFISNAISSGLSWLQDVFQRVANKVNGFFEQIKANADYAKELGKDAAAYLAQLAAKAKNATLAQIEAINAATKAKIQQANEAAKTGGQVVGDEAEKAAEEGRKLAEQVVELAKQNWNQEVQHVKEYYANKGQQQVEVKA